MVMPCIVIQMLFIFELQTSVCTFLRALTYFFDSYCVTSVSACAPNNPPIKDV